MTEQPAAIVPNPRFLSTEEVVLLTGVRRKSTQVERLRAQGIPFWLNASGHPVVPASILEPSAKPAQDSRPWTPKPLRA